MIELEIETFREIFQAILPEYLVKVAPGEMYWRIHLEIRDAYIYQNQDRSFIIFYEYGGNSFNIGRIENPNFSTRLQEMVKIIDTDLHVEFINKLMEKYERMDD